MKRTMECDVCGRRRKVLLCREDVCLCNDCYERLDQLDRNHVDPAWHFARAIIRNAAAASEEGIQ